ncbi:related to b-type cyclin 2 [Pseudozyma flocculosa]|uniref:Related to b-type cyclin 2 n=1 Tax=Pseudozyma flocculosa TaxID=84751 RepID=A0A5C3EZN8_9BASI|nr:related to b-type cyclin 2 [Pseudozyma flocculosa]
MAQPAVRPSLTRPRATRTGIPASRSGERIYNFDGSSSSAIRAKAQRAPATTSLAGKVRPDQRTGPARVALSDVSNRAHAAKQTSDPADRNALKAKLLRPAATASGPGLKGRTLSNIGIRRETQPASHNNGSTSISGSRSIPEGVAAIASGQRGPGFASAGSTAADEVGAAASMDVDLPSHGETVHIDDADSDLDRLAEDVGSDSEDEDATLAVDAGQAHTVALAGVGHIPVDEMSEVESTYSSDEDDDDSSGRDDLRQGGQQWLDPGSLSAPSRPESVTSAEESDNFELDIDPECIVSLHPELEAAAQEKIALIKARYTEAVVRPRALRAQQERHEAVARGEIPAELAAHEDELAVMGLEPDEVRDTTMVAEYAPEIFAYMSRCEKQTMANPNYMEFQNEIQWHMRATLVDWLLQVHMRYHMLPETLWIAINIVDRFLSVRVVSLAKLQLVGVSAMFIAAKYEEILAPGVDEFVFMTENGYSREEILKGERIILATLDFNVSSYCSPYSWVRRISKADDYDIQTRTLSKFLMELTLLDHRFLRARPSLIAAIGMFLAKKMLAGEWDDAFVYHSNFTEEQLVPGANLLLERLLDPSIEEQFVYRKYANKKKFLRASVYARKWAIRNHNALMAAAAAASSTSAANPYGQQPL